jgi:hypothetical protein
MPSCRIEYASGNGADVTPCGKPVVAECADCGVFDLPPLQREMLRRLVLRVLLPLPCDAFILKEAGSQQPQSPRSFCVSHCTRARVFALAFSPELNSLN